MRPRCSRIQHTASSLVLVLRPTMRGRPNKGERSTQPSLPKQSTPIGRELALLRLSLMQWGLIPPSLLLGLEVRLDTSALVAKWRGRARTDEHGMSVCGAVASTALGAPTAMSASLTSVCVRRATTLTSAVIYVSFAGPLRGMPR